MSVSINSDSGTYSCNVVPVCAAAAGGRPGSMKIPQDIIASYVITAWKVRELLEKAMRLTDVSQITCGFLESSTFIAVSEIREIYVNEFNNVNRKARSEMQSASEVVRMYFVFMRSFEHFTTTILKLESSLKVQ